MHNHDRVLNIVFLLIIGLLVFIFFVFLDGALGGSETMNGIINDKYYEPSYVQTTISGKTTITTVIPESWHVQASFEEIGMTLDCSVDLTSYNNAETGSHISASVSSGYWTDNYYCNW